MTVTKSHQVRVKPGSVGMGGRPRQDLDDVNKDEAYQKAPSVTPVESLLLNDVAKNLYSDTAKILVHRQQLKPAHISLLVTYANAFAVTVMKVDELIEHRLVNVVDDKLTPAIHTVYSTYAQTYMRSMQLLRLDPKTELLNSMAKATADKGTQYIEKAKALYDEM